MLNTITVACDLTTLNKGKEASLKWKIEGNGRTNRETTDSLITQIRKKSIGLRLHKQTIRMSWVAQLGMTIEKIKLN